MLVSIIIACRNEGDALWKTLRSCLSSTTGMNVEFIVADDGSTDDSIKNLRQRYPEVRIVTHPPAAPQRGGLFEQPGLIPAAAALGASPTKDLGARSARGEVLIFLDGHCHPEPGAIARLAQDIEMVQGRAIVTPVVTTLDPERWINSRERFGHGYALELENFQCGWLPLRDLKALEHGGRRFYQSPGLIGCAFAVHRDLYALLQGFDPHMRHWGVEDLDFGLKCWLMGFPVLHDPHAEIGHRFRRLGREMANVSQEQFLANQLRMGRKHFTDGVWSDWVRRCQQRYPGGLAGYPQGLWARAWEVFNEQRESVEAQRAYLMARRVRDEFWFAEEFDLAWPRLHADAPPPEVFPSSDFSRLLSSPPPDGPRPDYTPPCDLDFFVPKSFKTDPILERKCCPRDSSGEPVRYFNGELQYRAVDLNLPGLGHLWEHARIYSNRLSISGDIGSGFSWLVEGWPYLIEIDASTICFVQGTRNALWFELINGEYVAKFGSASTLTHDTTNGKFILGRPNGEQWVLHDFDQTSAPPGLFASFITAGGQETEATSYDPVGRIEAIESEVTLSGTDYRVRFAYGYNVDGRLTGVTFARRTDSDPWEDVRRATYEYYGSSDSNGSAGDLMRVRIQQFNGTLWDTLENSYYRYYKDSSGSGFLHGLKFIVGPQAYHLMEQDSLNPLTVSDSVLSQYADNYLEYDGQQRVTKEVVDLGLRTYLFDYVESSHSENFNHWAVKTTETLPDGSEMKVYTNYIGQVMLREHIDGTDSWIEYMEYNADARVILEASPSAVLGYNDSSADLSISLRSSDGLIRTREYYTSTSGTGVLGYTKQEALQRGSAGDAVPQLSLEYTSRTIGDHTVYPVFKETRYRNEDGTGAITTSYVYSWYSGTFQVEQTTTSLPAVATAHNGSGSSTSRREYFDVLAQITWRMDERGFITREKFEPSTRALVQRIDDVDTSQVTDEPSGWTTPSGGGHHLVSDFEHDAQGRITQQLGPSHTVDVGGSATTLRRASWNVYQDTDFQSWTGQGYATGSSPSYTFTLINPVSITEYNRRGNVLQQIEATRSSTSGKLQPSDTFAQSSYVSWTVTEYTDCCLVGAVRVYHTIPNTGQGSSGTNYDETTYTYDNMRRRIRSTSPGGTIEWSLYDVRGLLTASYVGTNDSGGSASDPTGGGSDPNNNMVIVSANQYDGSSDGGEGNLTQQTQYVDSSTTRVTTFTYDWRNRQTEIDGEIDYFQKSTYDNLDQVIKVEGYDTSSSGNLISRDESLFDDRGRIYRRLHYGVNPSTGTVGNSLTDDLWYDASGNVVKRQSAGSQLFTKTTFDSLGRATHSYHGFGTDASYSDVFTVTGDVVMEQTETTYDDAGNAIETAHRLRYHNAPAAQTGALASPSTTPNARVVYMTSYPDPLGRSVASVDYGTNGGSAPTRPSTVPSSSDTVLVSQTSYDAAGRLFEATDLSGKVHRTLYDDAGRRVEEIDNYVASPSPGTGNGCDPSDDVNLTTQFSYTADGALHKLTAVNSVTGNQVTEYVYGTTLSDSEVASSQLLREEIYPDSGGSSDRVKLAYNRQQERIKVTDQRGSVREFSYDLLGRLTQDRLTTLGTGVDGAVRRIETAYNVRGQVLRMTSLDSATVGSGNVVNEILQGYNDFGQNIKTYQNHSGAVNPSTSPSVQMTYADGSDNTTRRTSVIYPDGRTVSYDYGTSGSITDASSQVAALVDDDGGSTHLAEYAYLGLGQVVQQDSPQADLRYTLVDLSLSDDPDTGDIYSGLDRFGRVKDLRWRNTNTSSDLSRILYGYDRAGNRTWRENPSDSSRRYDWLYGYDGVHRLQTAERGQLNSGHTAITSLEQDQCWTLDPVGNWDAFRNDADGDGTWDLIQARTANTVNEITDIDNTTGSSWATPAYDAAGNMTAIPRPDAGTDATLTATWDGWNRPVKLVDPSTSDTVAEFAYDGRNFRIMAKNFSSGTLDHTRHYYFNDQWQALEERIDSSSDPERQHVWGVRYIDDLVLRDRDTDANGTLDERLYSLPDANWNVTAVVDDSGAVQERIEYTPYGVPTFLSPSFSVRSSSSFDIRYSYTTREWTPEISLYYFRNRWYQPQLGAFCSRDPIGYEGSEWNLFRYVANRALSWVDWDGLRETLPIAPADPGLPPIPPLGPLPPGADGWECKGGIPGPSKEYWLYRDTCCKVHVRLSIRLTRCFRPGWIGGPDPVPGETPEENARRWARNFFTKVSVRMEVKGSQPSGCAERKRTPDFHACSVFPGRYISSVGPVMPELPDDLDGGDLGSAISEVGDAACDKVRKHPWGITGPI